MTAKADQLTQIAAEVDNLTTSPLYDYRTSNGYHAVPGEGSADSGIVIIGEAPGKKEAETGRPFVGASGKLLDEMLASIGLARADVFITNVVKDRPPKNRDPSEEEIALYSPFLDQQLAVIQPRVIATLGRFAMDFALSRYNSPMAGGKISKLHGQILEGVAPFGPVSIVPLYHPAVALYQRSKRPDLFEDFATLRTFTG